MPAIAKTRGRPPVRFNPDLMNKIFDQVSEGPSLKEVCKAQGMPAPRTVYRWLRDDEELWARWQVVKELRSHSLFDHALDLAQRLADTVEKPNSAPINQTNVRAVMVAIETFKDAAGKLNPHDYGQRRAGQVVVPIQIVTNMNMGQDGKPAAEEGTSIYEITVPYQVTDVPAS